MNAQETAELLARECADGMHTVQHMAETKNLNLAHPEMKKLVANMIMHLPLVELIAVAEAAELELKRAKYLANEDNAGFVSALRLPTATESVKNLETVLTALRAKLPKGAL